MEKISLDPQLEGLKTTVDLATFTGYDVAILTHKLVLVLSFTYNGSGQTPLVNLEVDAPGGWMFIEAFMGIFPCRSLAQCEGRKLYVEHNHEGAYRFINADASREAWLCPPKTPDGGLLEEANVVLEEHTGTGGFPSVESVLTFCEGRLEYLRSGWDIEHTDAKNRLDAIYTGLGIVWRTAELAGWFSVSVGIEAEERYDQIKGEFLCLQKKHGIFYDNDEL